MGIYIQSAAQISIQQPLSDEWMHQPIAHTQHHVRAIEPNFRDYLEASEARRMGRIQKRAMVTAIEALRQAQIDKPDAIITGTGLGCVESTEKFLQAMVRSGEDYLQPTHFMQSTHNTIGSQIAVKLGCHGYNNTHVQDGVTFESALLDAVMNFETGRIRSALITANDELTPDYFTLLGQIGYWKQEPITQQALLDAQTPGSFAGEVSTAIVLDDTPRPHTLCALRGIELLHKPSEQTLQNSVAHMLQSNNLNINNIDAVLIGKSGDRDNDAVYNHLCPTLFGSTPLGWYKHIFGEAYTASGLGLYVATKSLKAGYLPAHLMLNGQQINHPRNILLYNHFTNRDHALILLSLC